MSLDIDYYWRIDFLHDEGESFIQADFEYDHLIIYTGMFGIPGYFLWHCNLDKALVPFIGGKVRISIIRKGGPVLDSVKKMVFEQKEVFAETYSIKTVIFDPPSSRFKIYGISSTFQLLEKTKAFQFKNLGPEGIDGYEVLYKLTDPLELEYYQIRRKTYTPSIKYTVASFDPTFSLLDIISKVCIENAWEFYIIDHQLHIGNPWWVNKNIHKTKQHLITDKLYTRLGIHFRTFYGDIVAASPGVLTGGSRILWLVYTFGSPSKNNDTIMHGVASNTLSESITEENFIQTLGGTARQLGLNRLSKSYAQENILLGKVFGDFEGDETLKNEYKAPTFRGDIADYTKDLSTREYVGEGGEHEEWAKFIYNENVKMTTPYAGDGVGILFPQDKAHKILFSPGGDREVPIVGPSYFGADEEVPFRESAKDFRLQLPNAVIYVAEDGDFIIELETGPDEVPTGTGNYIKIGINGEITIESLGTIDLKSSGTINIEGSDTKIQGGGFKLSHADHKHMVGNMGIIIPAHIPTEGTITTEGD